MKKIMNFLVSLIMTITLQVLLGKSFYPWIFDEVLGKGKLETIGTYGTVIIGIIVVIVSEIRWLRKTPTEEIEWWEPIFSLIRIISVSAVTFVVCFIGMIIIDFIWYLFDNIFGIIMSIVVFLGIVALLFGGGSNGTRIRGIFWRE